MADALIFLKAVEWTDSEKTDKVTFVTHNTNDFSDQKQNDSDTTFKERLAPDLLSLVDGNGMSYGCVIGRVLNDVQESVATPEEIERGEAVVDLTRMWDELTTGSAVGKLFKNQEKIKQAMSGGAMGELLEDQEKMNEIILGGAVGKMLREQEKLGKLVSGVARPIKGKKEKRIINVLCSQLELYIALIWNCKSWSSVELLALANSVGYRHFFYCSNRVPAKPERVGADWNKL